MAFKIFVVTCITMFTTVIYAAEQPLFVQSELKTVTVYRSGAELIHSVGSVLKQGNNEVIIEGVSNQLDINSIQVNCPASVTILSVEFSNNYLKNPELSPRIQLLTDSLEQVQKQQEKLQVSIATTTELLEVLKANRDIKGSQSGLSVAELMRLMDYYKIKSMELQAELASLKEKNKKLALQGNRIRQQISEEELKNTRTSGRIHLQLSVAVGGKAEFTVSYVTPNAYWTPYYDIRVDNIKSPLKILYKAKIVQTTGFDWKQVKLSLSTSVPGQWGNAPTLRSWFLGYLNPVRMMEQDLARNRIQSLDEVKLQLAGKAPGIAVNALKDEKERSPIYVVNGAVMSEAEFRKINPSSIANREVMNESAASSTYGARARDGVILITLKDGLGDYVSITDNELNVSFDIDLPYDVPTNGKEQSATLKEYSIDALYKYYSVPKMDKDAYLLAEVPDWEKLNLLPGDANIIFEGTYVGKSFIDPNSTFDTLNLTLGRDRRVAIKREKLGDFSGVKFLGSNKVQKITYELTVKNNKKDIVKMLLKDQFPLSTNKEIEVELNDNGNALLNPEIGVLTWKVELQPGESKKFRFAYSVRYPKDKVINIQ